VNYLPLIDEEGTAMNAHALAAEGAVKFSLKDTLLVIDRLRSSVSCQFAITRNCGVAFARTGQIQLPRVIDRLILPCYNPLVDRDR